MGFFDSILVKPEQVPARQAKDDKALGGLEKIIADMQKTQADQNTAIVGALDNMARALADFGQRTQQDQQEQKPATPQFKSYTQEELDAIADDPVKLREMMMSDTREIVQYSMQAMMEQHLAPQMNKLQETVMERMDAKDATEVQQRFFAQYPHLLAYKDYAEYRLSRIAPTLKQLPEEQQFKMLAEDLERNAPMSHNDDFSVRQNSRTGSPRDKRDNEPQEKNFFTSFFYEGDQ